MRLVLKQNCDGVIFRWLTHCLTFKALKRGKEQRNKKKTKTKNNGIGLRHLPSAPKIEKRDFRRCINENYKIKFSSLNTQKSLFGFIYSFAKKLGLL